MVSWSNHRKDDVRILRYPVKYLTKLYSANPAVIIEINRNIQALPFLPKSPNIHFKGSLAVIP